MTHGSLFSGIGGFDLAAQWMGWDNKFHCEWNEFGQRILHHYWPNAELFTDITKSDFTKYANQIDILTGGFPCQPYSAAGKRLGKNDERHLWPEMLRAIREIAPRWVVGENVRGLLNWNGGMVFDEVCTDLETLGYQVAPYLIPACAVNAPHKRERIWFVAYCDRTPTKHKISTRWNLSASEGNNGNASDTDQRSEGSSRTSGSIESNGGNGYIFTEQWRKSSKLNNRLYEFSRDASDSDCDKFNECNGKYEIDSSEGRFDALNDFNANDERGNASDTEIKRLERLRGQKRRYSELCGRYNGIQNWENFPTQSPICGGDDGLPIELDGITFSKWRNESIKAYGNAVVPQVVYQIFKAIQAYEQGQR